MARTHVLFPGSVLLLLLFVITEEIYQERILCQRGHCVIFQFPVFEFLALPFFLSLLSSFLSLWFYGNGKATERGSSSRRFFSKTTPFEHLGLGTGLFHYFSPQRCYSYVPPLVYGDPGPSHPRLDYTDSQAEGGEPSHHSTPLSPKRAGFQWRQRTQSEARGL